MAHEVGHENKAALQNADEYRTFAGIVARYLRAELRDLALELLLGNKYLQYIIVHTILFRPLR